MLHVKLIMIYIIHKFSVLLKITRTLFKEYNRLLFFLKKLINFFKTCDDEKFRA